VRRAPFVGAAFVVLFLLHNDLWWWNDPSLVLGMPVGLTYHTIFCLAAAAVMAVASRRLGTDDER
jgi:hypothetical protein